MYLSSDEALRHSRQPRHYPGTGGNYSGKRYESKTVDSSGNKHEIILLISRSRQMEPQGGSEERRHRPKPTSMRILKQDKVFQAPLVLVLLGT